MVNKMKTIAATAALATTMMLSAQAASATTITLNTSSAAVIQMECPSGCEGLIGSAGSTSWSGSSADGYDLASANEAEIATSLSGLLGITILESDVTKTNVLATEDGTDFSYGVVAGMFFAKYGQLTSFFQTDTAQTVTFTKGDGGPAELSNYGTIDVGVVPLPAAGWLLLMGLGGLGVASRRKRKAQAA